MATTTFVDGETLIEASWLNDVNTAVYNPAAAIIPASSIVNTPAGNIAATNVQTALNELDTEKQPLDATLTALAGTLTAANKITYATALNTAGELDWNSATALAASSTTISSNTVIKTAIDDLVVSCTTAASDGAADYIVFEDATDNTQKKVLIDTAVADSMNASGTAPMYAVRAFVSFDATRNAAGGTDSANTARYILSSGNITSVTKTAAGTYTVAFTVAMPDANYVFSGGGIRSGTNQGVIVSPPSGGTYSTTALTIFVHDDGGVATESPHVNLMVLR